MRILYPNLLKDASTQISGTGWTSIRDVDEIILPNLDDFAESETTSATIDIDLATAKPVKGIAIAGHNLNGADEVTFRVTNNSDYTGGNLYTLNLRSSDIDPSKLHYIQYCPCDDNGRYIRISITAAQIIEIGYAWVGEHTQLTPAARNSFTVDYNSRDVYLESPTGRGSGDKGPVFRSVSLSFPKTDKDTVREVRKIFNHVGTVEPVIFMAADENVGVVLPMYARFEDYSETINLPKPEYEIGLREGR